MQQDYIEAWTILEDSPRMSSVLSRQILADLLKKYPGKTQYGLAKQIDAFLGMTWKSYAFDHFIVYHTAYEGQLYKGKVKTQDSRARIPIPQRILPYVEAWRRVCADTSPDTLMFPTEGHLKNKGKMVPFRAKNFFKWKVWPVADKLGIPRKLCTFQVLRRTLGTDLQTHGTMKDAQAILRHKQIKTTAEVYMDHIPESVRKAIDSRTEAVVREAFQEASSEIVWGFARFCSGTQK